MIRTIASAGLALALLLLAPSASAFASDDAAQIQGLVQQIERLQAQINTARPPADPAVPAPVIDAGKATATLEKLEARIEELERELAALRNKPADQDAQKQDADRLDALEKKAAL